MSLMYVHDHEHAHICAHACTCKGLNVTPVEYSQSLFIVFAVLTNQSCCLFIMSVLLHHFIGVDLHAVNIS